MARVVKIDNVIKHPNADALDLFFIGGWQVVAKTGDYKTGDLAIFCEVDSFVPTEVAPFLTREGSEPKEYNGIKGERLKTIRLRGELSQGLLLSIASQPKVDVRLGEIVVKSNKQNFNMETLIDEDVSELLGVIKWERPELGTGAKLGGNPKGNFPSEFPKTDQERIQNLSRKLEQWIESGEEFEVTEKLEGSSMTCYLMRDGTFGVCSRNLDLKRDKNNTFWSTAIEFDVESKMKDHFGEVPEVSVALQGELIGPGIQGNIYKLEDYEFRVFDIVEGGGKYLLPEQRRKIIRLMDLPHVPVVSKSYPALSMGEMLEFAEGTTQLTTKKASREGLVFKSLTNPNNSFKVISNEYLLKQK